MTDATAIDRHLPLTPLTLHVLVALAPGPSHGYAVIKAVREGPTGGMNPGTGTFYSAIRRMEQAEFIREVEAPAGDTRRRSYEITDLGRDVLDAEVARLQVVLEAARAVGRSS
ncbi:MAG: PadR family transcriptional regulator [Acidobacteria bacterium]|nr:PadR family transcriptional regulator [Acidobacteriota bacterium]